jgi:hypothetical protein
MGSERAQAGAAVALQLHGPQLSRWRVTEGEPRVGGAGGARGQLAEVQSQRGQRSRRPGCRDGARSWSA